MLSQREKSILVIYGQSNLKLDWPDFSVDLDKFYLGKALGLRIPENPICWRLFEGALHAARCTTMGLIHTQMPTATPLTTEQTKTKETSWENDNEPAIQATRPPVDM